MHPLLRFCFHPTAEDRFHWAWIYGIMAVIMSIVTFFLLENHHWIAGILNGFNAIWNALSAWVAILVHSEWKRETGNKNN